MKLKFEYKNNIEREEIIKNNKDKFLIEEMNIIEGNFLVFNDIKPIENEISEIKQQNLDIMQGLADLWKNINGGEK